MRCDKREMLDHLIPRHAAEVGHSLDRVGELLNLVEMICHQGSRVHVCHLGLLKCKDIVITNAVTLLFATESDTICLYRQVCRRG